ncbi:E3 ubiquitin-protein ligase TRIM32 [Alligator mississippiensis]|uniref:E3 ubiquitin-protein ligase TRIM32 n=1 Tax=Alligator mississippiensis TaxID=8496 RepID=A0A151NE54_ALLMI|nr:E3 ubiquitin-protein ligase TRIM32 [Alligator mississippiensis]KYO35097.1 E3 ubiquitin-protein ligase TRIM32 [Alligator mississippiensis]
MYSPGYSTIVTAVDIQFGGRCGQVLRGAACLKKNMLDSYFLKELDDEQVALFEFNKGWKLSGIQKLYYNCLVKELGGFGTDPGKFIWPTSVTMTLDGDLAVKDSGNEQIQLFCSEGLYKHRFSYGSGTVKGLGDIVCIQDGLLLVTDGSKAIKVFSRDGEMIHQLKSPDMDWNHSYGMAILKSNDIAITDWTDLGKIHIIRIDLRMSAITRMYVMDGFHRPEHIAVNKREEMLVTKGQLFGKKQGSCLKVVNKDRIQKKTIGPSYENRITFVNPSGVCVDSDENLFVADRGQNYIVMFNPDASLVALVVNENLEGPCGLSVTKDGLLAVADCYHHSVKLYRYK